jgi:beta-fructofuranosidase
MIVFTAISQDKGMGVHHGAEQWGAIGDEELCVWRPTDPRPVLAEHLHPHPVYEWRDPYCFQHEGRHFMVLGGNESEPSRGREASPCVFLYEATDASLERWKYKGVLFRHPDKRLRSAECPCFLNLGDRWVLIVSPYGPVEWYSGVFLPDCEHGEFFRPEDTGKIDGLRNHYASTVIGGDTAAHLLLGWVGGFPEGLGWNGVLALPRKLSLRAGKLYQTPGVDLSGLVRRSFGLQEDGLECANTLRIRLPSQRIDAERTIAFEGPEKASIHLTMGVGYVAMDGQRIAFGSPDAYVSQAIVDRRMTEVFTDSGECVTFVHTPLPPRIRISASGICPGEATVKVDELRPTDDSVDDGHI